MPVVIIGDVKCDHSQSSCLGEIQVWPDGGLGTPPGTYLCSRIPSEDRNPRYLTANLIRVVDEVQSVNQVTEVAKTKV